VISPQGRVDDVEVLRGVPTLDEAELPPARHEEQLRLLDSRM
jgi:hypothetical protein